MPIGILNLGGVRGEEAFFKNLPMGNQGEAGVRVELGTDNVLPGLVDQLRRTGFAHAKNDVGNSDGKHTNSRVFKDMLS